MVANLIRSLGGMDLPDSVDIRILIVENDDAPRTQGIVEALTPLPNGLPVDYVLESELGIPFARNRAAHEAVKRDDDLLVFVDDDEIVTRDWLVRFVSGYRESRAVLLGGPVLAAEPLPGTTFFQALIYNGLRARYLKKEIRSNRLGALNDAAGIGIWTSNWMAEVRLFSEAGLWFDPDCRFSGGEDARFDAEVRARGFAVGWVKDALVYEMIPPERLSLFYQFLRAREQSTFNMRQKLRRNPAARLTVIVSLALKTASLTGHVLTIPFRPAGSLLGIVMVLGWCSGRLRALAGKESLLYKESAYY